MRIIGTGSALPKFVATNQMLSEVMDTSDEWISTRTGIKRRHLLVNQELEEIGVEAIENALKDAGITVKDLDYIICSNTVNEYITPGLGCVLQGHIGATCPSIDINAACAGFLYGMQIAESFIKTGVAKKILIVAAEEPSRIPTWTDRSTSVLFGDGAGAVIVSADGDDVLAMRSTTTSAPIVLYSKRAMEKTPFVGEIEGNVPLVMNGREVFRMAVSNSQDDIKAVMEEANITSSQVKYFVLHQANIRIIESIRHFLDEPEEKFPTTIENTGNMSSACIPILLDRLNKEGKLSKGDILVFSAFGAGFQTSACVVRWNK